LALVQEIKVYVKEEQALSNFLLPSAEELPQRNLENIRHLERR